jgi:hypothetical protein
VIILQPSHYLCLCSAFCKVGCLVFVFWGSNCGFLLEYVGFLFGASTQFRVMTFPQVPSCSHSLDTPHSLGILWTRPLPNNTTLTRGRRPCPPAGFEPAFIASERPLTHALERTANGVDDVGVAVCYSKSRVLNLIMQVIAQLSPFGVQRMATEKVTVTRNDLVTSYVCAAQVTCTLAKLPSDLTAS